MNERIAKKKTCPFIQNGLLVAASVAPIDTEDMKQFADRTLPANIDCITTDCMAWKKQYPLDVKSDAGYCMRLEEK